jgi:hypothetical protein
LAADNAIGVSAGTHRIEQRQGETGPHAPQNRPPTQALLGDEHDVFAPLPAAPEMVLTLVL